MVAIVDTKIERSASLEETIEYFSTVDVRDQDVLLESTPQLQALANNRRFLTEMIAAELKNPESLQQANLYSAQVFFLGRGRNCFMRANFWPAAHDAVVVSSGPRTFFYGIPHDHNFDFLTVGYYGPGYLSDFYEYDYAVVTGYLGERVQLRYIGREALPTGRGMLYYKSKDIHSQLPPESFSISLNLMVDIPNQIASINQYILDLREGMIESLANRTSLPLICEVAGELGDENCADVLEYLAKSHPYPRGRFAAYSALARIHSADASRIWERAANDPEGHVSIQARMQLGNLARRSGAAREVSRARTLDIS